MSVPDVFFSFAEADRAMAEEVVAVLLRHGVRVWFAPHDVAGAAAWQKAIGAALKRCDWFVVLVTKRSVDRMWVQREVAFALNRQTSTTGSRSIGRPRRQDHADHRG